MSLKDDPAFAFLFKSAIEPAPSKDGLAEWVETDGIFKQKRFWHSDPKKFCEHVNATWKDPVQSYREYAEYILKNISEFSPENRVFAELRAKEILVQVERAKEANDCAWLLAFTIMHYLRREIEILRVFVPLAKAKLRSQSGIPNMQPGARQAAHAKHEQWKIWAAKLVEEAPEFRGNNHAIAEEIRSRYGIKNAIGTIRKKI